MQEGTIEPASLEEELPELAEVLDALDADESVTAEEVNLSVGGTSDPDNDLTVVPFAESKVKVSAKEPVEDY